MRLSISEFLVKLTVVFGWLNFVVHEYSHLFMLRLLGEYGEIRSTGLNLTYPTYNVGSPAWHRTVVGFAGGFGVFLTFIVLAWRNEDSEGATLYSLVAIMNLLYGVVEGLYPSEFWGYGSFIGMLSAVTYFVYLLLIKKPEITM